MKTDLQLWGEAQSLRRRFGEDAHSPLDIFHLIANDETMTLVFFPMNERISGLCIKADDLNLIGINSTLTYGRQRFTAAHELYHLFFDDNFSFRICHQDFDGTDPKEREANKFASYFLAPFDALRDFIENRLPKRETGLTVDDVVRVEQHFGLSRHAALVRLQQENYLTPEEAEAMKTNIRASARKLGYPLDLYFPTPEDRQYATYGRYVASAELLREKRLISAGKYEELLLDAFRSDIVFDTSLEEERYD